MTEDERLQKANRPGKIALELHPFYKGKVEVSLKAPVRAFSDFAIWYTPGVAKSCLAIRDDPKNSWSHTNRANTIAVISDGTRVLGLGDIGPEAAMPVRYHLNLKRVFHHSQPLQYSICGCVYKQALCLCEFLCKEQPHRENTIFQNLENPECRI